ncbi:MAG: amino acid-binding protein [Spirochaetota bacterium]
MRIKQTSVFLENKPGHLQNVLKILGENDINIRTLTIAEVSDFGIVRMIVDKPEMAHKVLKAENVTSSVTEVLGIGIEDTPGSLYKTIEYFKDNDINIEYMYAFPEKKDGKAVMIFRFEDIDKAQEVFAEHGFNVLKKIDIIGDESNEQSSSW